MTLQDWGAIGELVGGVAVIATLVYLALQIRQYALGMSSATFHSSMQGFNQINAMLVSNPALASMYDRGMESPSSLSPQRCWAQLNRISVRQQGGTLIRAAAMTIVEVLLFGACLFGAAGSLSWPMAWAVLGIYSLPKAAAFAFLDPELLRERAAPGPGVDRGDVVLATLGFLALYPGTFVVAGLDAVRFGPALPMAQSVQVAALLVFALGYGFAYWAVYSNPFFATFVRIQEDRDHSVVSSGPYALIRHPGYAGVLLAHLALPFALGSIWALLPAALGTLFFVARTSREDRTLRDRLVGYREYQVRVRWRLLPGVW